MMTSVVRRLSCLPTSNDSDSDASYEKVNHDRDTSTAFEQSLASSFLISADMSHSVNPNYSDKYEKEHKPLMNKGVVVKVNASQRYATNSAGIVLIQEMARRAKRASYDIRTSGDGIPLQLFVVKNDCPCGSTIG